MSARDVIANTLENTPEGQSEWGHIGRAAQILDAIQAMPEADRIAMARALVPAGYVVAKVPDECAFIDPDEDDRAFENGWNACRAAMLASSEETP